MSKGYTTSMRPIPNRAGQHGVVMLEALVAILLFSMGVLAVVGLQAAMVKNTSDSKFRADASYLAQQWIGQMWSDPNNLGAYTPAAPGDIGYDVSAYLPSGTRTVVQQAACSEPPIEGCLDPEMGCVPLDNGNCPYVIKIEWQQQGQDQPHQFSTTFNIAGG